MRKKERSTTAKRPILALCVAAAFALGGSAAALAAGPAVSGPNGKVSAYGGDIDGHGYVGLEGVFSAPLSDALGFQLDVMPGKIGSRELYAGGFHLFARDPQKWLVGIGALHARVQNIDIVRAGVEGERFFKAATVAAKVGHQAGDLEKGLFGSVDLRIYPNDRLALGIGAETATGNGYVHVGAEYLPGGEQLALFADASVGAHDYDHVIVGVRYYLGEKKSLKRRHREDDPLTWGALPMFETLRKGRPEPPAVAAAEGGGEEAGG